MREFNQFNPFLHSSLNTGVALFSQICVCGYMRMFAPVCGVHSAKRAQAKFANNVGSNSVVQMTRKQNAKLVASARLHLVP
jgi:hypothetical protein